jgi:hypothetical protein
VGRTGLVAVFAVSASAFACARDGILDPPVTTVPSSGTAGAVGAPQAPVPPPRVAGAWLLYGFEDPMGVDLMLAPNGSEYDLTGKGCDIWTHLDAAWAPPQGYEDPQSPCGVLQGQGAGPTLEFAFTFPNTLLYGTVTYGAKVQVSKDGTRMAGDLLLGSGATAVSAGHGFGWFRRDEIGRSGPYNEPVYPEADLGPFPLGLNAEFRLALQGDAAVGGLVPGQTYVEKLDAGGGAVVWLRGDLGAFWSPDFHWDGATRTYTAGPVPETLPGFPVKLELHLNASDVGLHDAVVTMADGTTGTLLPVSP